MRKEGLNTFLSVCSSEGISVVTNLKPAANGLLLLLLSLFASGCATLLDPADTAQETPDAAAQAAIARGDQLWRRGDVDRALFEYVRALSVDPKIADAHYKVATIHGLKGNIDLAEQGYRNALGLSKDHAGALEGLGLLLLHQRKVDEAKPLLTRAVAQDPKRWRAHNGLAVIADMEHDFANSERHYQAALAQKPDQPMLLTNFGYSKYAAGNWSAAESYFEKALARDPRHAKAWSNLGLLRVRQGDYDKAMDAFSRIMSDAQASNNIGYLCMIEGNYGQAEKYFIEAIKRSPSFNSSAYENLAKTRALNTASAAAPSTSLECR